MDEYCKKYPHYYHRGDGHPGPRLYGEVRGYRYQIFTSSEDFHYSRIYNRYRCDDGPLTEMGYFCGVWADGTRFASISEAEMGRLSGDGTLTLENL